MIRPIPFVLAASDHGPVIVNRLDFHQLSSGIGYGVGHQILTRGAYEPEEILEILAILENRHLNLGSGVIALDCGANIGIFTLEMARHMLDWGKVIGVEAQERIYYALCGNIALSNLFNASALNSAIGSEAGIIEIPKPNYNKAASFGSLELRRISTTEYIGQSISYAKKDLTKIPMTTIDLICEDFSRVDFVKIDIEGMEIEAIEGAAQTLTNFRPTLWVEWIKSDRSKLQQLLESFNYSVEERGANLLATFVE